MAQTEAQKRAKKAYIERQRAQGKITGLQSAIAFSKKDRLIIAQYAKGQGLSAPALVKRAVLADMFEHGYTWEDIQAMIPQSEDEKEEE